MKKMLLFFVGAFILMSCEDDSVDLKMNTIVGRWKLESSSEFNGEETIENVITNFCESNSCVKDELYYVFHEDSTFEFITEGLREYTKSDGTIIKDTYTCTWTGIYNIEEETIIFDLLENKYTDLNINYDDIKYYEDQSFSKGERQVFNTYLFENDMLVLKGQIDGYIVSGFYVRN